MSFNTGRCSNKEQFLQTLTEIENKQEIPGNSDLVAQFLKNNCEWCQPSDTQLMNRVKVLTESEKEKDVITLMKKAAAFEKAKASAEDDPEGTAENFQDFGIKSPEDRIAIARICFEDGIACIAPHFSNFDIPPEYQKELAELLELSAQQDAPATVEHFADFQISEEAERIRLVHHCIDEKAYNILDHLDALKISDPQALIGIAIRLAKTMPKEAAAFLIKLPIKDPQKKLQLVTDFMELDLAAAIELMKGFGLKGEAVKELAKQFARRSGLLTFLELSAFQFESPETRNEIRLLCAQSSPKEVLEQLKTMKIPEKEFQEFAKSFLRIHLNALELFHFTSTETDVKKKAMDQWSAAVALLKESMDEEALVWAEPLLNELAAMPSPEERWELTGGLLAACQDAESRAQWQELSLKPRLRGLAIPLMELQQAGVDPGRLKEVQARIASSFNHKGKFKDRTELRLLFSTLHRLTSPRILNAEELEKVLDQIFQPKEDKEIIKNLISVRNILHIGGIDRLKNGENFQEVLLGLFKDLFALQSSESDLSLAMNELVENEAHLELLLAYASSYQSMNEAALMECFGETLRAVLEGRFKELRYSFENNPHLQKIFAGREQLLEIWRKPIQFSFTEASEKPFNPNEWLQENAHYLEGFDLSETPKDLGAKLKKLEKGSPEQVKVKLQLLLIRFSKMDGSKTKDILRALDDMVEVGGLGPLLKEIADVQNRLRTSTKSQRELTVKLTDEPFDLLGAGQFADSCLAPGRSADTNRGLLGIWRDGKTQMIGVYDDKGKLIARCLPRVMDVEAEKGDVILLDNFYPIHGMPPEHMQQMLKAAKMKADEMSWTLLSSKKSENKYPHPLISHRGPAPWDYCDAAGSGVKRWGEFTVEESYRLE